MKERAGKGGAASNSVYYGGVQRSSNNADRYWSAQGNTGANNMKYKITQLQDNGKTLTGKGKTLADARKALDSQVAKKPTVKPTTFLYSGKKAAPKKATAKKATAKKR
jgi:hypothetical protein